MTSRPSCCASTPARLPPSDSPAPWIGATADDTDTARLLDTLESQAALAACDAIARGRWRGQWQQWVYAGGTIPTTTVWMARVG